jgi:hypothetical protein
VGQQEQLAPRRLLQEQPEPGQPPGCPQQLLSGSRQRLWQRVSLLRLLQVIMQPRHIIITKEIIFNKNIDQEESYENQIFIIVMHDWDSGFMLK